MILSIVHGIALLIAPTTGPGREATCTYARSGHRSDMLGSEMTEIAAIAVGAVK